jgi:hypothetical protein
VLGRPGGNVGAHWLKDGWGFLGEMLFSMDTYFIGQSADRYVLHS